MSVGTALMTADEFLALPNDGVERWLVRGEVREFGMMVRNRWHSRVEARVVQSLLNWLDLQPLPRGAVYSGEAGFRPFANLHFFDAEGTYLFITSDSNSMEWRRRPRRRGLVRSRCRIPGNFFAEGGVFITAAVSSLEPTVVHAIEHDAVAFHVFDASEGDGVRGEWVGDLPGVVRPMFEWDVTEDGAV
jgi:hypothetical protein